ncbi:hypothetical protein C8Q78DRAFT_1001073 [Trametes maxima]|nr:hypothetical protein C8Q78DRAFT_1001073 [Trametes maxima]
MSASVEFDATPILKYLGLPETYEPSPRTAPIDFLHRHVRVLPPHLLRLFSANTTPKQRTVVSVIRNRRLKYTQSHPHELSAPSAKSMWPMLWEGRERPGKEQAKEEREWAEREFLGDGKLQVGKLGALLGNCEEERESERVRAARRQRAEYIESLPEEDESGDEDEEDAEAAHQEPPAMEDEEVFLRLVKERFIHGFLEVRLLGSLVTCGILPRYIQFIDYDQVDWDERLDEDSDRDTEDRWFDEEEES